MRRKGKYCAYLESHLFNGGYKNVEFLLKGEDVMSICTAGPNDLAVKETSKLAYVRKQLEGMSNDFLLGIVRSYGLDEDENHETREDLENFLVWSAAWDIMDMEEYAA